jgi:hypothetical protein
MMYVSAPVMKKQAERLAKKLFHNNFKTIDGWMSLLKCRLGMKSKKAYNKKGSADAGDTEQWKSSKLPNLLRKCYTDDIYNSDETDLFYLAMLDFSVSYKHNSVWFKENNGSCKCVVLFKHVRN